MSPRASTARRPATAAAGGTPAAVPRHRPRPVAPPRRVSGPSAPARAPRAPRAPRVARPAPSGAAGAVLRVVGVAGGISASPAIDRLVRGRAWVGVIAVMLTGIVAMQVHMLGLNAGIGRAVERTAVLEQQGAALRMEVSRLSSSERLTNEAQRLGLVMPAAGQVHYADARSADPGRAARAITAPSADLAAAAKAAVLAGGGMGAVQLPPGSPAALQDAAAPDGEAAGPEVTGTAAATTTTAPATATQAQTPTPVTQDPAQAEAQAQAPAAPTTQTQGQAPAAPQTTAPQTTAPQTATAVTGAGGAVAATPTAPATQTTP